MYLSKIVLNTRNRGVMADISNMYSMHQTLISMLPGYDNSPNSKYLYRLEQDERLNTAIILMQSEIEPCFDKHFDTGYLQIAQSKEYSPKFNNGEQYRFRLFANAVRKRTYDPDKDTNPNKKIAESVLVPMYKEDEMEKWLSDRAISNGFELLGQPNMAKSYRKFSKKGDAKHKSNLFGVQYDGILRVTDSEQFTEAVCSGIGKGKAFGFGLLSIVKII